MKPFFESKTNWVGIVTFLISLFTYFQGLDWVQANPKIVSIIGMTLGVLTIVLRMLSTEQIKGWFPKHILNISQNSIQSISTGPDYIEREIKLLHGRIDGLIDRIGELNRTRRSK